MTTLTRAGKPRRQRAKPQARRVARPPGVEATPNGLKELARQAVMHGRWMIRADDNGVAYRGFEWCSPGQWTVAPDWNENQECGNGLHGQDKECGGYIQGNRLLFCEWRGSRVGLRDKIKVSEARILLVNELPDNLIVTGALNLSGTKITSLPKGLSVGGWLDLHDTEITSLPEGLSVGGSLGLSSTKITSLPEGFTVSGALDLRGTEITSLPEGLSVGGSLYLSSTEITSLPKGLSVGEFTTS